MGALQQSLNQALTGATFLLQQTPWWQGGAETQKQFEHIKNLDKSLHGLSKQAGLEGKFAEVMSTTPSEKQASEAIAKAEMVANRYRAAQNEIDIRTAENPSLGKKYQRWKAGQDESLEDPDFLRVVMAERGIEKAKKALMERQNQYSKQKEQQEAFKNNLKISKADADELRNMGYGEKSIKGAKYN